MTTSHSDCGRLPQVLQPQPPAAMGAVDGMGVGIAVGVGVGVADGMGVGMGLGGGELDGAAPGVSPTKTCWIGERVRCPLLS